MINSKKHSFIALIALMPIMLFGLTEKIITEKPAHHDLRPFTVVEKGEFYPSMYNSEEYDIQTPSAPEMDEDETYAYQQMNPSETVTLSTAPSHEQVPTNASFRLIFELCKQKVKHEASTASYEFKTYITGRQAIAGGIFYGSIALGIVYLYSKTCRLLK
ncbi:hypothetical protein A3F06_00080 [candidate division TM6 bacterium RIFCSPHIGHO2_12_FULL_36_22]|nr:MAG: hypothetical protein A3F06_00080 [candidate division TM6 bacterium RIFCSPHIGHO2_12_FULL_36_22]